MPDSMPSAKSIFLSALEIDLDSDQMSFVRDKCKGHADIQAEVERLLDHKAKSGFLEQPAAANDGTMDFNPIQEKAGSVVGPYRLMEQVGEGGFGLVFVAEQHRPMRRKVALKIIKPGMDTKEVIARFEAERQALALMDHPNIAKVLDAGVTESGRPYFAMELIRGIPIVDYCDDQELSTRERLELFIDVCRAVQHAHAKGVIHRDLKPNNILVSPHDGLPVVKVIDFGIAKAIGQQLTDKTIYTRLNQMVGTPLYMSPEQAEINALDVDIRSDVYSLGVLLYELLAGTTPFDRERFSQAAYEEIKRIIREEEPLSPSKRLSTLGETLTTVSKQRKTDPNRLTAALKGELDWIVMCCLEKDRTRRYQTAAELAADVSRHLRNEPVQVVPPSPLYKARKVFRRNRIPITIVASYVVLSLIGLGLVWGQKHESDRLARVAVEHEKKANESARELVAKNKSLASTLTELNDVLLERALAAALSGDGDQFAGAIRRLEGIDGNERSVRHMRALFELSSGNPANAMTDLNDLVESNPDDIIAWSILSIAAEKLMISLDVESVARAAIEKLEPQNDLEKLLKAFALPSSGIEPLEAIVESKPYWGIARAIAANAFNELANTSGNAQHLASAREHVDRAILFQPDNLFAKSVNLQVLTTEIIFFGEEGNGRQKRMAIGQLLAEELAPDSSDYVYGIRSAAEFYAATGNYNLALNIFAELMTEYQAKAARLFYNPLLVILDQRSLIDTKHLDPGYYILANKPSKALKSCRDSSWANTNMGRVWKPIHLRMLGRNDEADEATRHVHSLTREQSWWIGNVAKLLLGEFNEETMLESSKENRWQRSHHLMTLAWYCLAYYDDRREDAIAYIDMALELDTRPMDVHFWCLAMKKKLEDPSWPKSLRRDLGQ